jgi:glyoxylase-like metal-dependent hydrolase (beta-lactamase superfamily II)
MRGWRIAVLGGCVIGGLVISSTIPSAVLLGQSTPATIRSQSLGVADNLYLLSGGGGNTLLMTGDDGVVIVDPKGVGAARQVAEIAAGISDQPVTTLICTHGHADHCGGVSVFPRPVQIVAHGRAGVPGVTTSVDADLSLLADRDRIDMHYFGAGHTGGDLVVVFPAKRLAYLGDLFPEKAVPTIDRASGGSALAFPETLTRAVAQLQGITRVIPGHAMPPPGSPLGRWMTLRDVEEYAEFTRDLIAAVRAAFVAGRSPEEAAATLVLPDRYAAYTRDHLRETVEAIYDELR